MKMKRLPSPAMVVACIALTVALGGVSYAATLPRNSVGTAQLKRGAVTAVKVRRNTLTGTQINEARLGRVPSAARATTAGAADSADAADQAGRAPVTRLDYRSSAAVPLPPGGNHARGTATCDTGLNAVGGGAKVSDPDNALIIDSNPVGRTGWEATGFGGTGTTMTVFVICAQAATTTP
jgi:hypothetical protein